MVEGHNNRSDVIRETALRFVLPAFPRNVCDLARGLLRVPPMAACNVDCLL
jgi:hypothetical protein